MPATSTTIPSVQLLDFEDIGLLVRHGRLYAIPVRRAGVLPAASFGFSLATDTLAVRPTVPAAGHTNEKGRREVGLFREDVW